jgi:hypothetical protein
VVVCRGTVARVLRLIRADEVIAVRRAVDG